MLIGYFLPHWLLATGILAKKRILSIANPYLVIFFHETEHGTRDSRLVDFVVGEKGVLQFYVDVYVYAKLLFLILIITISSRQTLLLGVYKLCLAV